ncbi:universal stress protein [Streptomyces sp. NRRL F-4474]|uniref:universal stress protein n=1 Tax=Streptomyces sp. NRRL F-4474 TaxID=1463851 RepID=UPI0004C9ABE5|nr:universal stress protein [Streptomyces sp. NRRL F-4474]
MDPVVTVGLDGSPESVAAARWAADEAQRRRLTLRLLHAWPMLAPDPAHASSALDQNYWAKKLVHTTRAEIQATHPGLTVIGELVAEDAQDALLRVAAESELTVLGSRGLESVPSYFLGDISTAVVGRAVRPVVVVRAGADEAGQSPPPRTAAVVAALKLAGPCDDLLAFAFEAAAARGLPLRAVHGETLPLHAHMPWGADHEVTREIEHAARTRLNAALQRWRVQYPDLDVVDSVSLESPARAVAKAAETAAMLVVGRRKDRPPLAPCLGSVAQAAIHHARCPVAVVPHD